MPYKVVQGGIMINNRDIEILFESLPYVLTKDNMIVFEAVFCYIQNQLPDNLALIPSTQGVLDMFVNHISWRGILETILRNKAYHVKLLSSIGVIFEQDYGGDKVFVIGVYDC